MEMTMAQELTEANLVLMILLLVDHHHVLLRVVVGQTTMTLLKFLLYPFRSDHCPMLHLLRLFMKPEKIKLTHIIPNNQGWSIHHHHPHNNTHIFLLHLREISSNSKDPLLLLIHRVASLFHNFIRKTIFSNHSSNSNNNELLHHPIFSKLGKSFGESARFFSSEIYLHLESI